MPSRDVDCVEILGHLGDHGGLKAAVGEGGVLVLVGRSDVSVEPRERACVRGQEGRRAAEQEKRANAGLGKANWCDYCSNLPRKVNCAYLETVLENFPELLGLGIAGIFNLEVAALGDDLLGREGALGVLPAGILPPGLDLSDLLGKEVILDVGVDGRVEHVVCGHDGGYQWVYVL